MTLRFSDGYRNAVQQLSSCKHVLNNAEIRVFTGTQPSDANQAETGTLLFKITKSGGTRTSEVRATGSTTLTGGSSGSVDTLTVNSIEVMGTSVPFNTSLTQTAADVVTMVNNNPKNLLFFASSSGAVVTLTAKPGLGTLANGWVVAGTSTTITQSYVNIGSGVAGVTAVNGVTFNGSTAGALTKNASETWSGTGVANGTAGWFRVIGSVADAGSLDSSAVQIRVDGAIATSGSEMNMSNTTVAISAVQTVNTFTITEPAA